VKKYQLLTEQDLLQKSEVVWLAFCSQFATCQKKCIRSM